MGETFILENLLNLSKNSESLWYLSHNSLPYPLPDSSTLRKLCLKSMCPRRGLPRLQLPVWSSCFILSGGSLLVFLIPLPSPRLQKFYSG